MTACNKSPQALIKRVSTRYNIDMDVNDNKLKVGDLVVLSSNFEYYLGSLVSVDNRPGLIVSLVDHNRYEQFFDHENINMKNIRAISAHVLWPDGRLSEVHTMYLQKKEIE